MLKRKKYLALINRAGGLYGRILTKVYTPPRSRFSHTDRLSSVNKMFIVWENLDCSQYPFQPIKFKNLVVPSPCETEPYNKVLYLMVIELSGVQFSDLKSYA